MKKLHIACIGKRMIPMEAIQLTEQVNEIKNERNNSRAKAVVPWSQWFKAPTSTISKSKTITGASGFSTLNMAHMPAYANGNYNNGLANEGNCAPTALTTIAKYWAEKRGKTRLKVGTDIRNTYRAVAKASKYKNKGLTDSEMVNGIKAYAKDKKYTATVNGYLLNNWSDFTRDLNNNKTVLLALGAKTTRGNSYHASVAFGYAEMKDGSKYLRVANGWNTSSATHLKF